MKYKKLWEYFCNKPKVCAAPTLTPINKNNKKKKKKKVQIVEPEKDHDALTLEISVLSPVSEKDDNVPVNTNVDFDKSDNNEVWSDDEGCVSDKLKEKISSSNWCQVSQTPQRKTVMHEKYLEFLLERNI